MLITNFSKLIYWQFTVNQNAIFQSVRYNQVDNDIKQRNVLKVECYGRESLNAGNATLYVPSNLEIANFVINLRYNGSENAVTNLPLTRLLIGTLENAYNGLGFNKKLGIDLSQSDITILNPITLGVAFTSGFVIPLLFHLSEKE